ncbi:TPA: hypothetical protein ACG3C3_003243 [Stenotrophomonas maltophilia]
MPIIRPFPITAMHEPMVVDFELTPPGPNAAPTLLIGLRVKGEDDAQVAQAAERLVREGLPAEVLLERVEQVGTEPVPLTRRQFNGFEPSEVVAVGPEGRVPGVVPDSADDRSLVDAGLAEPGGYYRTLTFAWAEQVKPGHYRLHLRLLSSAAGLQAVPSELQLAYTHRAK